MKDSPKILVVEDSSLIRRIVSKQLEKFGATVAEAENGRQGLELAHSGEFDLVLSDVEMPFLDGFTLCQKLKENPKTQRVPVVILSTLDTEKDIERGFSSGADAYVSKSEAQTSLIETIERVLERSRFHRSHTVLVVDDSSRIRKLVAKALGEAGFQVMTAANGKEAMSRMAVRRPDLILSDIDMPEMNGIDLCRSIQSNPELSAIPLVVMSATSDRAVMRRLVQWGAASFLVKPFNVEQVVITVERLLSDHFTILLKERERLDSERKMMLASITSLVVALEARDPYTRGHSEAVAMLVSAMAHRMGCCEEDIETLTMAGRLHDLGKIGVPDSILLKPGPLTTQEYALIKEHPVIGASILGSIPSMKPILPVILHHHERYDGKGYPDGIQGKKIMQWARMTAVADTYHALTSDRPYRKGKTMEEALAVIEDVRGSQLCPECVDAFLKMLHEDPSIQHMGRAGTSALPGMLLEKPLSANG
jgi:putative two-component system response regulator